MKAVMLTGINSMKTMEVPDPGKPAKGELLLRVDVVGVCGSDIHYYTTGRIGDQVVRYPFTVGHEFAGTVLEVGEDNDNFMPGDRVAVDPAMPCYQCDQCKGGREHTCRNLKFVGCPGQAEGSLSEMIIMPSGSCFHIPVEMSLSEAALAEPLSIGYYAAKLSQIRKGDNIAILGAGPIGDSVLVSSRAMGAGRIHVTDKIDSRLDIAVKLGADSVCNIDMYNAVKKITTCEPLLLDIVFECCGKQEALDQAVELLKPGGKLVIVGIPQFEKWTIPADKARRKELSIINVRRQNDCMPAALDMISSGIIDSKLLITHTFKFEDSKLAFDLVTGYRDDVLKAMIKVRKS